MANDPDLLAKMAAKLKRDKRGVQSVREGISRRASEWAVAPEAAQVIWAKELNLGTGRAFRKLSPDIQRQVQEYRIRRTEAPIRAVRARPVGNRRERSRDGEGLRAAIRQLVRDPELIDVCADVLKLARRFDRAVNHATQVLENRLRVIAGSAAPRNARAHELAAIVLHPQRGPLLRVDPDNAVQEGYYSVCAGLFASFRNPTHHGSKKFSREDAISVCGFINVLLDTFAQRARGVPAPPTPATPGTPAVPALRAPTAKT